MEIFLNMGYLIALKQEFLLSLDRRIQVQGGVTSLTCRGQGHQFFVGTNMCQMYRINYTAFKEELIAACHNEAVNDIVFPV